MDGPPTYSGTRGRAPCRACNGAGTVQRLGLPLGQLELCIVCNGTRVQPHRPGRAIAVDAAIVRALRRNARTR